MLVCKFGSSLSEVWNWPLYTKGKEKPKTETGHPRLVSGKFNEQGNSHTRLVLGGHKTSTAQQPSLCSSCQILKCHREGFTGFSHFQCRWSQQHIAFPRPWAWKGSAYRQGGRKVPSKDGDGWGPALRSTGGNKVPAMTSPGISESNRLAGQSLYIGGSFLGLLRLTK